MALNLSRREQGIVTQDDYRIPVTKNMISQVPYCLIGHTLSVFKTGRSVEGTGVLVAPNFVLTTAHNVYRGEEQLVECLFHLAMLGKPMQTYRLKDCNIPMGYRQAKIGSLQSRINDFALLNVVLISKNHYEPPYLRVVADFYRQESQIMIFGYPKDKNQARFAQVDSQSPFQSSFTHQFGCSGTIFETTEHFIRYKINTDVGQSGAPIVLKRQGTYTIIGIHTGGQRTKDQKDIFEFNYGIRAKHMLNYVNSWMLQYRHLPLIINNESEILKMGELIERNRQLEEKNKLLMSSESDLNSQISKEELKIRLSQSLTKSAELEDKLVTFKKVCKCSAIVYLSPNSERIRNTNAIYKHTVNKIVDFSKLIVIKEYQNMQADAIVQIVSLNWKYLRQLQLHDNRIGNAGVRIFTSIQWQSLEVLDISKNNISEIDHWQPKNISKIKVLGLGVNNLSSLPSNIACLTNLQQIVLSQNFFKKVPAELQLLDKLTNLWIFENDIAIDQDAVAIALRRKKVLIDQV